MLSFLQAYRTEPLDNELMERAILDKRSLSLLMSLGDAEAVLSTFRQNFDSGDFVLSTYQRARIWLFGLWNTAYRNVIRFILHMSLENVRLSIAPRQTPDDPRVALVVRLVEKDDES